MSRIAPLAARRPGEDAPATQPSTRASRTTPASHEPRRRPSGTAGCCRPRPRWPGRWSPTRSRARASRARSPGCAPRGWARPWRRSRASRGTPQARAPGAWRRRLAQTNGPRPDGHRPDPARRAQAATAPDRPADLARAVARRRRLGERAERPPVLREHVPAGPARRPAHDVGRGAPDQALAALARRPPSPSGSRPSAARIVRLFSGPPSEYWPIVPSVRTTRWHGTISGTGLWPSAVPDGPDRLRPADLGRDPAVRPDLAARDVEGLAPDVALEVAVAAQVEIDAHPAVARQSPLDGPRASVVRQGVRREHRASGPGRVARGELGRLDAADARARSRPRTSGPIGESMRAMRSASPTSTRTFGRERGGGGAVEGRPSAASRIASSEVRGHAVISWRSRRSPPRAPCAAAPGRGGPGP